MTTLQIELEKSTLIRVAEKCSLDLQHPEVLAKSQEVDQLIVAQMRLKLAEKVS